MDRFRERRIKEEGERVLDAGFIVGNTGGEVLPGACTGEDTVKDAEMNRSLKYLAHSV